MVEAVMLDPQLPTPVENLHPPVGSDDTADFRERRITQGRMERIQIAGPDRTQQRVILATAQSRFHTFGFPFIIRRLTPDTC